MRPKPWGLALAFGNVAFQFTSRWYAENYLTGKAKLYCLIFNAVVSGVVLIAIITMFYAQKRRWKIYQEMLYKKIMKDFEDEMQEEHGKH
jgi:hypothetical protein